MAKKVILGIDIARDAFKTKINDNFTELYDKDASLEQQINSLATKVIAESGNNTNGRYVKFEDGTQICTRDIEYTFNIIREDFAFASTFAHIPSVSFGFAFTETNLSRIISFSNSYIQALSSLQWRFHTAANIEETKTVKLIAIGRWK